MAHTVDHEASADAQASLTSTTGPGSTMQDVALDMTAAAGQRTGLVDIVVPVHDEVDDLGPSIERLHRYLTNHFPFGWRITIVDNASTDGTWELAQSLAARWVGEVRALHLDEKGRGRALRRAWSDTDADVVAYMDVDLSTDLDGLLPLVAPLLSGHSDVAIGSRLAPGASVARGPKREAISRCYNLLLHALFGTRFRDAQCGFKAVRGDVARRLVPAVRDDGWFFDTELLLLAQHNGLRIHEVPVDWVDDPDSRVHVISTALGDLRGTTRMAIDFARGRGHLELGDATRPELDDDMGRQVVSFAAIGVASTITSLAIFLVLRIPIGPVAANVIALTATTVANAWANRRWTFRRQGREQRWRQLGSSIAIYAFTTVVSSMALAAVQGPLFMELVAITLTWSLATVTRFVLMRSWVFRRRPAAAD